LLNLSVELDAGPWSFYMQRKNAIEIQKLIVPWYIAQNGLAYSKKLAVDTFKEMVIAICGDKGLFQGLPLAAAQAKKFAVSFVDVAKRVKNAAGAYPVHTFSVQSFA
jgi:hypothetical protein